MRYLVMNIGCIECGVSSAVAGLYDSEKEAQNVAHILQNALSWRESGQNRFEVFDLHAAIAEEYVDAIRNYEAR